MDIFQPTFNPDPKAFAHLISKLSVWEENDNLDPYLQELKPESLNEIADLLAIFRPGSLDKVPTYISGQNRERYLPTPEVHRIISPTRGILIYTEQLSEVLQLLLHCSPEEEKAVRLQAMKNFDCTTITEKARKNHGAVYDLILTDFFDEALSFQFVYSQEAIKEKFNRYWERCLNQTN